MTRKILDKELQVLDEQIIRLGSLVDEALETALQMRPWKLLFRL